MSAPTPWEQLTSAAGWRGGWRAYEPVADPPHGWFTHLMPWGDDWGYGWEIVEADSAEAVRRKAVATVREWTAGDAG